MAIHPATDSGRDAIWTTLEPMIREGQTYTLPRDMSKQQALNAVLLQHRQACDSPNEVYIGRGPECFEMLLGLRTPSQENN